MSKFCDSIALIRNCNCATRQCREYSFGMRKHTKHCTHSIQHIETSLEMCSSVSRAIVSFKCIVHTQRAFNINHSIFIWQMSFRLHSFEDYFRKDKIFEQKICHSMCMMIPLMAKIFSIQQQKYVCLRSFLQRGRDEFP